MLKEASGSFDSNPVLYYNLQLRYHFGISKDELNELTDEEWAEHIAILNHIRDAEAKRKPFG